MHRIHIAEKLSNQAAAAAAAGATDNGMDLSSGRRLRQSHSRTSTTSVRSRLNGGEENLLSIPMTLGSLSDDNGVQLRVHPPVPLANSHALAEAFAPPRRPRKLTSDVYLEGNALSERDAQPADKMEVDNIVPELLNAYEESVEQELELAKPEESQPDHTKEDETKVFEAVKMETASGTVEAPQDEQTVRENDMAIVPLTMDTSQAKRSRLELNVVPSGSELQVTDAPLKEVPLVTEEARQLWRAVSASTLLSRDAEEMTRSLEQVDDEEDVMQTTGTVALLDTADTTEMSDLPDIGDMLAAVQMGDTAEMTELLEVSNETRSKAKRRLLTMLSSDSDMALEPLDLPPDKSEPKSSTSKGHAHIPTAHSEKVNNLFKHMNIPTDPTAVCPPNLGEILFDSLEDCSVNALKPRTQDVGVSTHDLLGPSTKPKRRARRSQVAEDLAACTQARKRMRNSSRPGCPNEGRGGRSRAFPAPSKSPRTPRWPKSPKPPPRGVTDKRRILVRRAPCPRSTFTRTKRLTALQDQFVNKRALQIVCAALRKVRMPNDTGMRIHAGRPAGRIQVQPCRVRKRVVRRIRVLQPSRWNHGRRITAWWCRR